MDDSHEQDVSISPEVNRESFSKALESRQKGWQHVINSVISKAQLVSFPILVGNLVVDAINTRVGQQSKQLTKPAANDSDK